MFVAEAHSFSQQARLAITLAWVAGYTNILTILTCGTVTSHVSGTTSNLGRDIAEGLWPHAGYAFFLLVTFFAGAALSAICTETGRHRGWESIYVLPIGLEAALLFLFSLGLEFWGRMLADGGTPLYLMTGVASAAMGLQNATITRISSGVVRTTHVTGVITDLGLESVQLAVWIWEKRHNMARVTMREAIRSFAGHPSPRRLFLLSAIIGSFALGAGLGTLVFDRFSGAAMFPPVLFLAFVIYQDISRPIAEITAAEMSAGPDAIDLPPSMALYHLRKNVDRPDAAHRLPNLVAWSERLPETTRVVVLDLGSNTGLIDEAATQLRSLLLRMRLQGRRMILAGLDVEQCRRLQRAWGEDLKAEDVCPNLDLALAHGIVILEEMYSEEYPDEV